MAQKWEVQNSSGLISSRDLRKVSVIRKLTAENRTPFLLRDGDTAICYIPSGQNQFSQSLKINLADAKKIASIRDRLTREQ